MACVGMNKSTKIADYLTLDVSPAELRFSKFLRSCSKDDELEGAEVFICGVGAGAAEGVVAGFRFAATDAGTKDIIDMEGFGADAGGLFTAAFRGLGPGPGPGPGPVMLLLAGYDSGRAWYCSLPGVFLRLFGLCWNGWANGADM